MTMDNGNSFESDQAAANAPVNPAPLPTGFPGAENVEYPNPIPVEPAGEVIERRTKSGPSRAKVRAFGKATRKGDRFINKFTEHGAQPGEREVEVTLDIRGTAMFALTVIRNDRSPEQVGKTTVLRGKTLLSRYEKLEPGE